MRYLARVKRGGGFTLPPGPTAPAAGSVSTDFDALYSGGWAANSATNALTIPTQSKPAKSTDIMTGGYRDQRYDTEIRRVTAAADQTGATAHRMRHEYSKRQAFNADDTKRFAQGESGWWFLYDAATNAIIPQGVTTGAGTGGIQGMAGDCEPIWHPTDPDKWWHTDLNGGLVWQERTFVSSGTAPSSSTLIDFTSHLSALGSPWSTGARVWFIGEGRPSNDGRWWGMAVETSGFSNIGMIMYDRQTNAITGSVLTSGNRPNWVGTSPLGNYIVASWYGAAAASIAAEEALATSAAVGVRAYDRSGAFVRSLSVLGEHADLAIDTAGNEVYVSVSFHGTADGLTDDCLFVRRLSDGTAWEVAGVDPFAQGTGGESMHISGCNADRPGWCLANFYGTLSGGPYGGTVIAVELKASSPRVLRLAHTHGATSSTVTSDPAYWSESQATVNRDFTRVVFASAFQTGDVEDYQICLPSWAIPT